MKKLLKQIKLFLLKQKLKKKKIFLRKGVKFEGATFEGCGKIGNNTNIKFSEIGYGTYTGKNCNLMSSKIGKFCSLGSNIKILVGNHPTKEYISTHPAFYSKDLKKEGLSFEGFIEYPTEKKIDGFSGIIGNDVWIGDNALILGGLKIGDGAIIGAGSVVTKNVESYSIVAGNPAKEIRKRFTDEEREFLKDFKWWYKDIKWIKENIKIFSDIKKFIEENKNWEKYDV